MLILIYDVYPIDILDKIIISKDSQVFIFNDTILWHKLQKKKKKTLFTSLAHPVTFLTYILCTVSAGKVFDS